MDTPRAFRKHVAIVGKTNAGKSSLFNALLGQDAAIVSPEEGTTTDPVIKSMELIPYGPIVLMDTAGSEDTTAIGAVRAQRTSEVLRRADLKIYVCDASVPMDGTAFSDQDSILVFSKPDRISGREKERLYKQYPDALFVNPDDGNAIQTLRKRMADRLSRTDQKDDSLLNGLLEKHATVVMVVPVDSEAPKGRLILPQVQLIRECLDHGMQTCVTRETELEDALKNLSRVDLVVTDSRAFACVSAIVPEHIPLTSFSMLLAHNKGDFDRFLAGVYEIDRLKDGDRILVLEGCTHNHTHEDIGRVKLPALLQKRTGKTLDFDFYAGYEIPRGLTGYAMAFMCGSCMINPGEIASRLRILSEHNIPVTNYGIALAYLNGVLERSIEIFKGARHD